MVMTRFRYPIAEKNLDHSVRRDYVVQITKYNQ